MYISFQSSKLLLFLSFFSFFSVISYTRRKALNALAIISLNRHRKEVSLKHRQSNTLRRYNTHTNKYKVHSWPWSGSSGVFHWRIQPVNGKRPVITFINNAFCSYGTLFLNWRDISKKKKNPTIYIQANSWMMPPSGEKNLTLHSSRKILNLLYNKLRPGYQSCWSKSVSLAPVSI